MNDTPKYRYSIEKKKSLNLEGWIKIVTAIVTSLTLILAYCSFQRTQSWKIAEYSANVFKDFKENPSVKLAHQILDYRSRALPIITEDSFITINDSILLYALSPDRKGPYTVLDEKIRDVFDNYFDQLTLLNSYIENGLIELNDVETRIEYYIAIIGDKGNPSKPEPVRKRIWEYIRFFKFQGVIGLLKRFGYDISL